MYRYIKKFLQYKKQFILFLIFVSVFFMIRFPWSETIEQIIRQSQQELSLNMEFQKFELKFLPPKMVFYEMSFTHNSLTEPWIFDTVEVSLVWSQWLALKKAWAIKAVKESSVFDFSFWQTSKKLDSTKIPYLFLNGKAFDVDLSFFEILSPRIKMDGDLSLKWQYEGSSKHFKQAKARLELKASQIKWLKSQIETNMGPLDLPSLKWSQAQATILLKNGDLLIESLVFGNKNDDLYLQLRGNGELLYNYGRWQLGSYDVQVKIEVSKNLSLSLLDLMLSGSREEENLKYIYTARITGQGPKPPNIEKLSEF